MHQKTKRAAENPWRNAVAVSAGALVAKVASLDTLALRNQLHPVISLHFGPVDRLVAAIPNGEDDPPLTLCIDLHAEVAATPTGRHVVGPDGIGAWR